MDSTWTEKGETLFKCQLFYHLGKDCCNHKNNKTENAFSPIMPEWRKIKLSSRADITSILATQRQTTLKDFIILHKHTNGLIGDFYS